VVTPLVGFRQRVDRRRERCARLVATSAGFVVELSFADPPSDPSSEQAAAPNRGGRPRRRPGADREERRTTVKRTHGWYGLRGTPTSRADDHRLGILVLVLAGLRRSAEAPPVGTTRSTGTPVVELSAGRVRVVLRTGQRGDPAFQARRKVEADRTGYHVAEVSGTAAASALQVDGNVVSSGPPARVSTSRRVRPACSTLRIAAIYEARLPRVTGPPRRSPHRRNEPDRLGWREIVVVAGATPRCKARTRPRRDLSDELRHYPNNLIQHRSTCARCARRSRRAARWCPRHRSPAPGTPPKRPATR